MPVHVAPQALSIADLPLIEGEAALFDAAIDPAAMQIAADQIIISLVVNP